LHMLVVAITNGSDDHTPDHHSSSDAQHTGPSIGCSRPHRLQPPTHPLVPSLSPQPARSAQPSSLRSTHGVVISLVAEPHLGRYGLGGPYQWPTPFDTIRHPINTSCPFIMQAHTARVAVASPSTHSLSGAHLNPCHTSLDASACARWKMMRNILSLLNPECSF